VRTRSADTPIGELSGGNVQRVVLARELYEKCRGADRRQPLHGLDFAAVAEIHTRCARRATGRGHPAGQRRPRRDAGAGRPHPGAQRGQLVHETTPANADLARIGAVHGWARRSPVQAVSA
jgi:simple sugar transport system ATP-binding protein